MWSSTNRHPRRPYNLIMCPLRRQKHICRECTQANPCYRVNLLTLIFPHHTSDEQPANRMWQRVTVATPHPVFKVMETCTKRDRSGIRWDWNLTFCFCCFECFAGQFVAVNELSDIKFPGTNIQASVANLQSAWIIVCSCQDVFNLSLAFFMQKQRHMACKYQLNVTFIRQWLNPCVWCPQSQPATHAHICKHTLNLCLSNIQFWVSISILPPEVHLWMHCATTSSFILMYVWAYVSCI